MTWPNWSMAPEQVAPRPADLQVDLIHMPAVPDDVATSGSGLGELRCEPMHPPVHRDVVDFDAALRQELLDIPEGKTEA